MSIKRNGSTTSFKLIKALILFSVPLVFTCFMTQKISKETGAVYQARSIEIQFSEFSPAYAAFEDEFLFSHKIPQLPLQAGMNNHYFNQQTEVQETSLKPVIRQSPIIISKISEPSLPDEAPTDEEESGEFRGLASMARADSHIATSTNLKVLKPTKKDTNAQETLVDEGEFKPNFKLNFGPMVASVDKKVKKNLINNGVTKPVTQGPKTDKPQLKEDNFEQNALKEPVKNNYRISGPIELTGGLAFVGSMEVSWVIDDQEIKIGSINTPDATYEVTVNDLIGDVIISLYDENDDLIGEGIARLDDISSQAQLDQLKIDVRPIDWDKAGEVIHVHSINSHKRPIAGAEVQLYAYNDSVETNNKGEIRFIDWKKSNSRTLALASKEGYKDSVFLIDSKKPSKVLLFQNSYIEAFFSWIEDLGIRNVKDMGTIYGAIVDGNLSLEGYQIRLEEKSPLYFNSAYFASNTQTSTGKNGLFAFAGIEDGDYELFIEKDGIIIDRRIVPVEQGKISPLFIDLKRKKKRLEFFDPHDLSKKPEEVAVQFFDGEDSLSLNKDSQLVGKVVGGSDPGLIDYASGVGSTASTFVTRQRGFERIAVINKNIVSSLIKSNDFSESNGLAVGYIQTDIPYTVNIEEGAAQDIIYFNHKGNEIDPTEEPAYGFIVHGFSQGLHTLSVETVEDNYLIMTDLIFSDHQSISVIHSSVDSL